MATASTTFNTRIKLKYDTYENWSSKNPTLLAGEIAIATIPVGATTSPSPEKMANLPNVVMKVGDGETPYNELKFVSALAADVYSWAKAEEKPTYEAGEIDKLDEYINGIIGSTENIQDTDTQYTIQAVAGATYKYELLYKTKAATSFSSFETPVYIDLSAVNTRLNTLEEQMDGKTVAAQIADALGALDMTAPVEAGQGEIIYYVNEADGIVEAKKRALVAADIPAIAQSQVTGLEDALKDLDDNKQDNLTFTDDYAAETSVVATKKYVDDAAQTAININNNDAAVEGQFVTAAVQTNGEVVVSRRALKDTDFAANVVPQTAVNGLADALAAKQDALVFESTPSETNKVATMEQVNAVANTVSNLDMAEVVAGNGEILATAVQEDGQVTITKRALTSDDFKADLIPEAAVAGLTEALDDLETNKQDNIVWADGYAYDAANNKAATVNYVASVIQGLNGAMHFIGVVDGETFDEAVADLTPAGGDVVLYGYDEYVYDAENRGWVKLGNESIYQTKEQAAADHQALTDAIALKQDALGFEGTYNKETNKVVTKTAMDEAIQAAIDIDVESKKTAGQVVLGVSQTNGEINVEHGALTADHIPELAMTKITGLEDALNAKQNALEFMTAPTAENKVATAAEISAVNEQIAGFDFSATAAKGQVIETITQEDGQVNATFRNLVAEDIPTIEQSQVNGLDTALAGKETAGAAAAALTEAQAYADGAVAAAIEGLDHTDTAVEGQVVTAVNMADGELTISRAAVNIKDLAQTTNTYVVFDCGSATVNI